MSASCFLHIFLDVCSDKGLFLSVVMRGCPFEWLQDASAKIMQFAQHGTRAMCVLSANGAVSNVMLRQDSSSGGTVTYEVLARGIGL